jgi:LSD1 subclass zinc finger protein
MINPPPVPHRCRRANRCAERERLDHGTVLGGLIPTEDGLCPSCTRDAAQSITALPTDYVELDMALGRSTTAGGTPVSGTRELPIPIQLAVEAMQAAIAHETSCWASSCAEVLHVAWDTQRERDSRPGVRIQRATHLLASSLSVLLALRDAVHITWDDGQRTATERDGVTGTIALLDLHWRARATLGRTRRVERLRTNCFGCGRQALEHPDGADMVTCAVCHLWWTWDEYLELSDPLLTAGAVA